MKTILFGIVAYFAVGAVCYGLLRSAVPAVAFSGAAGRIPAGTVARIRKSAFTVAAEAYRAAGQNYRELKQRLKP